MARIRRRRRGLAVAVVLSGAAHLGAVLLLTRVRSEPYTPPPPIDVVLAPADSAHRPGRARPRRREDARPRTAAQGARPALAAPRTVGAPAPDARPAQTPPPVLGPPSGPPLESGESDREALLGAVLQKRFDCDRRPSAEERERCLEARGAAARGAPPVPVLSRKRQDAFDGVRPPGSPTVEVGMLDIPGGALGLPPPIGVRVRAPRGKPPKAIDPIPASTLRGDDDALRSRPP